MSSHHQGTIKLMGSGTQIITLHLTQEEKKKEGGIGHRKSQPAQSKHDKSIDNEFDMWSRTIEYW